MRQGELLEKPKRASPRVMAHMTDAGHLPDGRMAAEFECKCGWRSWVAVKTVSEVKRGHPCPKCNPN